LEEGNKNVPDVVGDTWSPTHSAKITPRHCEPRKKECDEDRDHSIADPQEHFQHSDIHILPPRLVDSRIFEHGAVREIALEKTENNDREEKEPVRTRVQPAVERCLAKEEEADEEEEEEERARATRVRCV
jgi:hypothetical protein